jgi:Ca-activated chloride channel family protein
MMGGAVGVGQRANKQAYLARARGLEGLASAPAPVPVTIAEPLARAGRLGESVVAGRPAVSGPSAAGLPALTTAPGAAQRPMSVAAIAPAPGQVALAKNLEGKDVAVSTVRTVGVKTFFRRGDVWIDSSVTPEQEAKATVIVQFTDAYFQLAKDRDTERNAYLTFNEAVVVDLDGTVYRINPPVKR